MAGRRKRWLSDRAKARLVAPALAWLIQLLGWSWRFRVDDRAGLTRGEVDGPVIWVFWHNRVLAVAAARRRFFPMRTGYVLTSASGDGLIIAEVMRRLGAGAVRGSSSRGGAAAYRELLRLVGEGEDIAITPDGPRGPRHEIQPGAVRLALKAGVALMPVRVEASSAWRLKTWDRFMVPKPFARVELITGELLKPAGWELGKEEREGRVRSELAARMGGE